MPSTNPAELLLLLIVMQQSLALPAWLMCARLGIAPAVPAWHWAAASAFAAASVGAAYFSQDPWYSHGLCNMLAPGIFLTLRLGLQTLFRAPRHDGENLMVIVLSVSLSLAGGLLQAPDAWFVWLSSVLSAFCLWRCAQVVGPMVQQELGPPAAYVIVTPLRAVALLFLVRFAAAAAWPEGFGVPLRRDTPANVAVLAFLMTFGLMVHLSLGLAVALRLMARLRQLSRLDSLTGLPNRRAADEVLVQLIDARDQLGQPASVLAVDVDHFKRVNDQHGHLVGDRALVHLAHLLQSAVRGGDVVARVGGEELLVLMPNTRQGEAAELAERLRARVEHHPLRVGTLEVPLTVSIGLAELRLRDGMHDWVDRADGALYRAKHLGRNRVEWHFLEAPA